MISRSPTASPIELTALRHIADGRTADVNLDHLQVLFAMGLAGLGPNRGASLTIDGQQRLRAVHAEQAIR